MKYLKDLDIEQLKINELSDYAEEKNIDLDKEMKKIIIAGFETLYKKCVPKDRQVMIEHKLEKQNKVSKPQPTFLNNGN